MKSRRMKLIILLFFMACIATTSFTQNNTDIVLDENLIIRPLTENTFLHISYMSLPEHGKFPCNGLIYIDNNEAFLFDTPYNDSLTLILVNWITNTVHLKIKGIVVNHFHEDCLGGLKTLHEMGIPSYSHQKCIDRAQKEGYEVPKVGFEEFINLSVGHQKIACRYFGEAHSPDNIISWIPKEKVLFGGCMIKSLRAGKGNLSDANLLTWSTTIDQVKKAYPNVEIVVPGHGKHGTNELLNYTSELFAK